MTTQEQYLTLWAKHDPIPIPMFCVVPGSVSPGTWKRPFDPQTVEFETTENNDPHFSRYLEQYPQPYDPVIVEPSRESPVSAALKFEGRTEAHPCPTISEPMDPFDHCHLREDVTTPFFSMWYAVA